MTTGYYDVECSTPQGSLLSPVLYILYLVELLAQNSSLRFRYADDICLYRASKSLDINVRLLAKDVREILAYSNTNKIFFILKKLEIIHLITKKDLYAPRCIVSKDLTITLIIEVLKEGEQPALYWLSVWFDRKLTFKRHVTERVTKARLVAYYIRGLTRIKDGLPAIALRKVVLTYVLLSALYGTEA